ILLFILCTTTPTYFYTLSLHDALPILIIDDERLARSELKKLLKDFPDIEIVAEAANAREGIEQINTHKPNLIFLDIQMPDKTGLDRKSTRLNSSHVSISYAVFCLKKKR